MNWKKWLIGLAGVAVTTVAINLGVPSQQAIQMGSVAAEQLGLD